MDSTALVSDVQQMSFPATRRSAGRAREFAAAALTELGATDRLDDVRLCVSELAANAVVHGSRRGHRFLVRVAVRNGVVRLEVHDSQDRGVGTVPAVVHPAAAEASGRGLLIVETLADAWGVEDRDPVGKVVWAAFGGGRAQT